MEFVNGDPQVCRLPRMIPTPTVNPAPTSPSYLSSLPLALLPESFFLANLQRNGAIIVTQSSSPRRRSLAIPLSSFCKQTGTPIKLSRSPRLPEARRAIVGIHNLQQARRSLVSSRLAREPRRNPTSNR
jgi:hypothetical protein